VNNKKSNSPEEKRALDRRDLFYEYFSDGEIIHFVNIF
jgi:hypothetical protein